VKAIENPEIVLDNGGIHWFSYLCYSIFPFFNNICSFNLFYLSE